MLIALANPPFSATVKCEFVTYWHCTGVLALLIEPNSLSLLYFDRVFKKSSPNGKVPSFLLYEMTNPTNCLPSCRDGWKRVGVSFLFFF